MKKFTVKDFIAYGSTCVGCGKKVLFRLEKADQKEGEFTNIPITVKDDHLEALLVLKYSTSLGIYIYPKTNKFDVSNMNKFIAYLGIYDLNLAYRCKSCHSVIISDSLKFDSKGFIKPISLYMESFLINSDDNITQYAGYTYFKQDSTEIEIYDSSHVGKEIMKMPLFPIYKFKTRENFLKKIKTYILFS